MNEETRRNVSDQAADLVVTLERLLARIEDVQVSDGEGMVPQSVPAQLSDSKSLAEGIRDGWITQSQPRIATNLLRAVDVLDQIGQDSLSVSITHVLSAISSCGIAAENCRLGKGRSPSRF